jgi:hypothetical protein
MFCTRLAEIPIMFIKIVMLTSFGGRLGASATWKEDRSDDRKHGGSADYGG